MIFLRYIVHIILFYKALYSSKYISLNNFIRYIIWWNFHSLQCTFDINLCSSSVYWHKTNFLNDITTCLVNDLKGRYHHGTYNKSSAKFITKSIKK